jgi:hypothetical protein
MSEHTTDAQRRAILQIGAGLAATAGAGLQPAQAGGAPPAATGKPGDFDFLSGEWTIHNRQLKNGNWETFDSEATVHGILAGVASVEELRIPVRAFSGMGLRLLDVERKLWADFWVNAKSGVLAPPPSWGSFVDGVGIWDAVDTEGDKPVIYRGVWDQITPRSCRWYAAASHDDGKSWQQNWIMNWTRR